MTNRRKWHVSHDPDTGLIEIWSFSEEDGPRVMCHPDGRFELTEVTGYGGWECRGEFFPTLNEAMLAGGLFT